MLEIVVVLLCCVGFVHSRTPAEWKSRTIYQVLTDRFASDTSSSWSACTDLGKYCGGTWSGIESKLDYIQGMGFDAIWLSPMVTNLNQDYHGYAMLNLFELNPHFGTEKDLRSLISAAHARDIWIMLDVVANHVAPVDLDFSQVNPFNDAKYYHSKCQIENYNNQTQVELCRLANLPDLDQNHDFVSSTLLTWAAGLAAYGFDGLRLDTVPEVHADFWPKFNAAAGMYCVGEVFNGDINYVSNYQNYVDGVLSYPLYFTMLDVFARQQSMNQLEALLGPTGSYAAKFKSVSLLGTFADNHDNARFLYVNNNWNLYKNALALSLYTTGIPIVYYGSEQGYKGGNDPANRESLWPNYNTNHELYRFLASLVSARKSLKVYAESQIQRYAASNFYAFTRGTTLICLTNSGGSSVTYTLTYLPYSQGNRVCNVQDSSDCLTVNQGPSLTVTLTNGLPKVYALQK